MLDIEPKFKTGASIFDVAKKFVQKSSNSALAKKVLNSTTTKNLKRAADSAVGKEIKKNVLSGLSEASKSAAESAFQKLGLSATPTSAGGPPPKRKRRRKQKGESGIVFD